MLLLNQKGYREGEVIEERIEEVYYGTFEVKA